VLLQRRNVLRARTKSRNTRPLCVAVSPSHVTCLGHVTCHCHCPVIVTVTVCCCCCVVGVASASSPFTFTTCTAAGALTHGPGVIGWRVGDPRGFGGFLTFILATFHWAKNGGTNASLCGQCRECLCCCSCCRCDPKLFLRVRACLASMVPACCASFNTAATMLFMSTASTGGASATSACPL